MSISKKIGHLVDGMSVLGADFDRIEFSRVRAFAAYCQSLPCVEGVPSAAAFRMYEIPKIAPYTCIFGILKASPDYHIRLVGTKAVSFFGHDPTGKSLLAVLEEGEFRDRTLLLANAARGLREPILNQPGNSRKKGTEFYRVESLAVPLAGLEGEIDKLAILIDFCLSEAPVRRKPLGYT